MSTHPITDAVGQLLRTLPPHVTLVAAAKTRTTEEVKASIDGGVTHVGYNYVQEAEGMIGALGHDVKWHLIGHLQKNKAKKAAELFDMVETLDSWRTAQALDRHCAALGKIMPVLIEINSGCEPQKAGVLPDDAEDLAIRCDVNGESMQDDRTSGMIFSVPEQIEFLSRFCTLETGDLIFTGTPAGVGSVREPRRYLADGDVINSAIEGVGALCNRCTGD